MQSYGALQVAIEEVMVEQNWQPESCMIRKVIQLYETMIVRWGVMLVGPTGGGKSTILKVICCITLHICNVLITNYALKSLDFKDQSCNINEIGRQVP